MGTLVADERPWPVPACLRGGWDAFVNAARRSDLDVLTRAEMARLDEDSLEDYNEARLVWNANLPTVKTHQLAAAFAPLIDQVMASNADRDADRLRGSVVVDAAPRVGQDHDRDSLRPRLPPPHHAPQPAPHRLGASFRDDKLAKRSRRSKRLQ